jgi:hypothetical protein
VPEYAQSSHLVVKQAVAWLIGILYRFVIAAFLQRSIDGIAFLRLLEAKFSRLVFSKRHGNMAAAGCATMPAFKRNYHANLHTENQGVFSCGAYAAVFT